MEKNTREVVLSILLDIEKNHTFSNTALGTALSKSVHEQTGQGLYY